MAKMATGRSSRLLVGLSMGALALLAASGCRKDEDNIRYSQLQANVSSTVPEPDTNVPVGTEVKASPSVVNPRQVAFGRDFGVRSNPFSLLGVERTFHFEQQTERLLATFGGWEPFDVPEEILDDPIIIEPLPRWRLSGVIIGNGVLALLDTGTTVYEIRPGMTIPGTEWRVASIDDERAILVRDGNKLPREFQVDLQGSIDGALGGGGLGGGNTGGPGNTGGQGNPGVGVPGNRGSGGGSAGIG